MVSAVTTSHGGGTVLCPPDCPNATAHVGESRSGLSGPREESLSRKAGS